MQPEWLYHGSEHEISGPLLPVLAHGTGDHVHDRPAVFATERYDIAAMFMFPMAVLASIGFEHDIAYICIWGTPEEYAAKDTAGYMHRLSPEGFEKLGKWYEWQCFAPVIPEGSSFFPSVLQGMLESDVQVYFINDNDLFDRIVADKDNRAPLLMELTSENQRLGRNIRPFPR